MERHKHSRNGQARRFSVGIALVTLLLSVDIPAASLGTDNLEPVRTALRLKQFQRAATLLEPLADASQADAEYLLATLYRNGLGVNADSQLAYQWTMRAAEHGNTNAAYTLAAMLADSGEHQTEMHQWLQRAADKGHTLAQNALKNGIKPYQFQPEKTLTDTAARQTVFWLAARQDDVELMQLFEDAQLINASDEFGRTALSQAARYGALQAVTLLLQAGATVDHTDAYGITPLMLAAGSGHESVVNTLIKANANANTHDQVGNTALMYAAANNHAGIGDQLLRAGADIHVLNTQSWSALDWAVHANCTALASSLQAMGLSTTRKASVRVSNPSFPLQHAVNNDLYRGWPDVLIAASRSSPELLSGVLKLNSNTAATGPNGETPMLVAVKSGNNIQIEALLKAGASAAITSQEESPLSWAVRHNELATVQLLLTNGVDPNRHGKSEQAPLLDALQQGNEAIVNALLRAKANVNVTDDSGRTPLILVAMGNQSNLLQSLLTSSAAIDATDKQGRTALWYAAIAGAEETLQLLLADKASIEGHDRDGSTALMVAAAHGHANAVKLLIDAGASVNVTTGASTALMLAAGNGHADIVRHLLAAGSKVNIQNKFGDTALMFAVRGGHSQAAKALLDAGASTELRNTDRASAKNLAEKLGHKELTTMLTQRS
ncbi:MAG: ankyrin repeat domain-containing protein [Steroidobacteraceae bacterium]